jgi:DNA-binding MarR family transcriptional regulator
VDQDPKSTKPASDAFKPDAALNMSTEAEEILRAVRRIVQSTTLHSKRIYRDSGLTVPQLLCLRAIAAAKSVEVTPAQIARQVQLSPATVTGILDRLERYGLILRERLTHDRRKVGLRLTEQGHERLAAQPAPLQERFLRRLDQLEGGERQRLLGALRQVVDMMEAADLDASPILATGDVKKSAPEI